MIYFIQDEGSLNIKIGSTDGDPLARLKALQTGCPTRLVLLASMEGDASAERDLHDRFASARGLGEWFRPTAELLLFLMEEAKRSVWSVSSPASGYERYQFGGAVPITDFMHDEGRRSDFTADEQPEIWSQLYCLTCPLCTHGMRSIEGVEFPSLACPSNERSASVLLYCKEGCTVRFNFVQRDHSIYSWVSHAVDEAAGVFLGDLADERERNGNV